MHPRLLVVLAALTAHQEKTLAWRIVDAKFQLEASRDRRTLPPRIDSPRPEVILSPKKKGSPKLPFGEKEFASKTITVLDSHRIPRRPCCWPSIRGRDKKLTKPSSQLSYGRMQLHTSCVRSRWLIAFYSSSFRKSPALDPSRRSWVGRQGLAAGGAGQKEAGSRIRTRAAPGGPPPRIGIVRFRGPGPLGGGEQSAQPAQTSPRSPRTPLLLGRPDHRPR